MADIVSKQKRSEVMAAVRSHGNRTTELRLVALFRREGITSWRRSQNLFGKPDFVFPRQRVAVFVDGCFWHGCPRCYRRPATHRGYWGAKVQRNKERDREVSRVLRAKGWAVVRIWEHELRNAIRVLAKVRRSLAVRSA
jgi:DNA mismatch endonuclease (patch repair protein)